MRAIADRYPLYPHISYTGARDPRLSELFDLHCVSASRGGRRVLDDVSVRIPDGATALLGPSGSGKSSLLRLLNRLSDPDLGTIHFKGDDVRTLDVLDLRRRAVLVPQLPAPLPGHGGRQRALRTVAAATARPTSTRASGAPGSRAPTPTATPRELSVGEQQRVMLARALALEPEVLLLDEPTSALDEAARDGVERTLIELAQAGVAMVLVTHDRGQAVRIASKVVELREGRVVRMSSIDVTLTRGRRRRSCSSRSPSPCRAGAAPTSSRTSRSRCCARSSSSPRSAT